MSWESNQFLTSELWHRTVTDVVREADIAAHGYSKVTDTAFGFDGGSIVWIVLWYGFLRVHCLVMDMLKFIRVEFHDIDLQLQNLR